MRKILFLQNAHRLSLFIEELQKKLIVYFFRPSFPINWRTPFGYLYNFIAASLALVFGTYSFISILILLIGSCCILKAFAIDITDDLNALYGDNEALKNERKLKEKLCSVLQHFADAKQFSIMIFGPQRFYFSYKKKYRLFFFSSFVGWSMNSIVLSNLLRQSFYYGHFVPCLAVY